MNGPDNYDQWLDYCERVERRRLRRRTALLTTAAIALAGCIILGLPSEVWR